MPASKPRPAVRRGKKTIYAAAVAVIAGVALMSSLSSPANAAPRPGQPVPAAAIAHIRAGMMRLAKNSGVTHPNSMHAVVATRAKALEDATPGDQLPSGDDQNAYLIVLTGHFTLYGASVPPGGKIPTGNYLTVTLDPTTYQVMDIGLSDVKPGVPLQNYGPVSDLNQ